MTDAGTGRPQQPAPSLVKLEAGGLEHRPQSRGGDSGSQIAAQIRKALGRDPGPCRNHAVELLADFCEVERDGRRRLSHESGVGDDGRAEVAPTNSRQAGISTKLVKEGLQCNEGGGLGKGFDFHGRCFLVTRDVRKGRRVTGSNIREYYISIDIICILVVYSRQTKLT